MIHAGRTIKVNADPGEPALTQSHVWRGLMMKAENPLPFVPVITACRIVERIRDGKFVREIVDKGDTITEAVTFHPERIVQFERISGRVTGTILNEIIKDADGDLALRFTFALSVEGVAAGSREEKQFAAKMEEGYLMAVAASLECDAKARSGRRAESRFVSAPATVEASHRGCEGADCLPARPKVSAQARLLHQREGLVLELLHAFDVARPGQNDAVEAGRCSIESPSTTCSLVPTSG